MSLVRSFIISFRRCPIMQRLVLPLGVVEQEIFLEPYERFWDRRIVVQVHVLVFDAAP